MANAGDGVAFTGSRSRDVIYNLLNIIHHELEGAALSEQFAVEAESRNDSELEEFFRQISESSKRRAERARELLAYRRNPSRRPRLENSLETFSSSDTSAY